jgi:hypothetical protein
MFTARVEPIPITKFQISGVGLYFKNHIPWMNTLRASGGSWSFWKILPYTRNPENTDSTLLLTVVKRKSGKLGIIYMKLHIVASRELVNFIANTHRETQIWLKYFYRL